MTEDELIAKLRALPRAITTPRIRLTAPSAAQIPIRVAWAVANLDALTFLPRWRRSADPDAAARSCESEMRAVEAGEEIIFNVFEMHSAAYVGRIDLHSWDADAPRCEIGYMADARTAGRGLLREAALACVELALSMGVARVQAITDTRNVRSIRFAESIGMQREGVLRGYERLDGLLCDQVVLSLVRNPAESLPTSLA